MTDQPRSPFLRRMTRNGRPPREVGEISPAKALRLALAKAGQDVLRQIVVGSGIEEQRSPLTGIADLLSDGGLVTHLSGPGGGAGLVSLDRTLMSGVIEAMTLGRVTASAPADRPPSLTDALLCQRFFVVVMTVFAARLVGHPAAGWATGFVPEEPVDDLRRLPLILEDTLYRVLTVDVDIAGGTKTGQMVLVLPWEAAGGGAITNDADPLEKAEQERVAWKKKMESAVMPAAVELEAVLYRLHMPLDKVLELAPGSLLPIPRRALAEISVEGDKDDSLACARLGQSQGFRAVKFEHSPLFPDMSPSQELEQGSAAPKAAPTPSLVDAMANLSTPGLGDLPPLGDDDGEEGESYPPLDLSGLGDIGGGDDGEAGELPALDISSMDMDDLDDLPMSIE